MLRFWEWVYKYVDMYELSLKCYIVFDVDK